MVIECTSRSRSAKAIANTPYTTMSSRKSTGEAEYFNIETKLQYGNHEPLPLLVENYMMNLKVGEVKIGLLQLDLLNFVPEPADKLKLVLSMPGNLPGMDEHLEEMDDEEEMSTYRSSISGCKMFKLLPK